MLTLKDIIDMTYEEYVEHLLKKYGPVPENFVTNRECEKFNLNIDRSKEGLTIHHIKEKLGGVPINWYDYEMHKKENLVYCDMVEHFLLHVKLFYDPKFNYEQQGMLHIVDENGQSDEEIDDLDPAIITPEIQLAGFKMYLKDMIFEINRLYFDNICYGQPGPTRTPGLTTKILPKYKAYLGILKYILLVTGVGYMEQFSEAVLICASISEFGICHEISADLLDMIIDYKDTSIDL